MPDLPESVQVGPFRYEVTMDAREMASVRYEDGSPSMVGRTHNARQRINLDGDRPINGLRETLLHEVLHAVWFVVRIGDRDLTEEQVVGSLSATLLDTFRRNPALVQFLVAD